MYLNCHTYHSLRYGTLSPEQLILKARQHGVRQLALTDINNTTAMPEFVKLCRKHGLSPVAGVEFRRGERLLYIALARNPEGFCQINRFLSQSNIDKTPLPDHFPVCENTFVIYPFGQLHEPGPHEYMGVRPGELSRLMAPPLQQGTERPDRLLRQKEKLVALHTVSFGERSEYELHRHLRAIEHNTLLSRLREEQTGRPGQLMAPPHKLQNLYEGAPYLVNNAFRLLEACQMDFDFKGLKNKRSFTGHPADDRALLSKLAMDGLEYRYGKNNQEALRRVGHELEVIDRLGFSSYFLITWDIIRYSMSRGFYHVGRGSGANSIVAYCLRITDVDPIELDLYFERFINPKRSSPPDFDIDFSWKERDQVLDYIFKRYGHEHTALLGTCSTFRDRAMIRELGKVYGLPKAEIDALTGQRHAYMRQGQKGFPDAIAGHIFKLSEQLAGFPNLRSIHAGGVLISEKPICCYSALDLPPKGLPTVQWDMYTAEELGFEKIDILSQRGIGHINDCVGMIKQNQGATIDIHQVSVLKNDEKVKKLLRSGETTGCFYVESPAMRGLLKKLRCDNYTSLVAASSIIRPGVARSGMMREYIQRFHQPNGFKHLHPVMEQQLKETHGVMVYQEDVIKVCHHFAGLDLADADVLRRAMSGKHRSKEEMQRIIDRFFENCRRKGHPEALAKEVWRQIESFAGYSFSKAHSASYAVESYQSLYLKAHYPLEFMTAVINNFGGFYQSPVYFNEARRYGAIIELPCVNHSHCTSMITGNRIYIGFVHALNLERKTVRCIVDEREQNGPYGGLEDFYNRTGIALEQMILLIRMGALRFTEIPKARLLWEAHLLAGKKPRTESTLFPLSKGNDPFPTPETDPLQDAYDEMELLGFPVSTSFFDMLQTKFRGDIPANQMMQYVDRSVRMAGHLIAVKYVRTVKKEMMYFGCFLDSAGNFFDSVHFPAIAVSNPFRGNGVYLLKGTITQEFGFPSLRVEKMAKLPVRLVQ